MLLLVISLHALCHTPVHLAIIAGRWPLTPEADGTFFIDRDPSGFPLVLKCLRSEKINVDTTSADVLQAFAADVQYYGLRAEMVEQFVGCKIEPALEEFSEEDRSSEVTLSHNNLKASCTHGPGRRREQWVLGDNQYGCSDHVLITLFLKCATPITRIGVIMRPPAEMYADTPMSFNDQPLHIDSSTFGFGQEFRYIQGQMDDMCKSCTGV